MRGRPRKQCEECSHESEETQTRCISKELFYKVALGSHSAFAFNARRQRSEDFFFFFVVVVLEIFFYLSHLTAGMAGYRSRESRSLLENGLYPPS